MGGIQSYLWELWRRLPPEQTTVLTSAHRGAPAFDAAQAFRIERTRSSVLLPTPGLRRRVEALADEVEAGVVLIDPVLPLGWLGRRLRHPYGLVAHGAEVTVPSRIPLVRGLQERVVSGARLVVAAGGYPAAQLRVEPPVPTAVVPPGVDVERFVALPGPERAEARRRLGLADDDELVVSVSRLVPRKGMDVLIEAVGRLSASRRVTLAIAGEGRDRRRLERLARRHGAPVRLLGRVGDEELVKLLGCADVFAMLCRDRWGGLEQEGFGIVFLEAAAAGVPAVAGRSGGSHEAVAHEVTGLVVDRPRSVPDVVAALGRLLDDPALARRMGEAGRRRAEEHFTYERLAVRLQDAIDAAGRAGERPSR